MIGQVQSFMDVGFRVGCRPFANDGAAVNCCWTSCATNRWMRTIASRLRQGFPFLRGTLTLLLSGLAACCSAAESPEPRLPYIKNIRRDNLSIGGLAFVEVHLERSGAPPLSFFVSRPPRPAPLLLYIQGSGCRPAFVRMGDQLVSTVFSLLPTAAQGRYTVMVVDKPLTQDSASAGQGTAINCPTEFNAYFSFASWSRDLRQAVDIARALPWIEAGRMRVFGMSEGAVMAADLAGTDPAVTDVAMLGATGPSQLFDFIAAAYRSGGTDTEVSAQIEALEATAREIASDPDNATKFAWGHPYKRWSGFLSASSDRSLMSSHARMYLVSGMADRSVPILSTEALYSDLRSAGKDVTMRRIPDASHSLQPAGTDDLSQLDAEIKRVLDWFGSGR